MSHYFEDIKHNKEDYFEFLDEVNNHSFSFLSCNNVFSKEKIDYGTKVLLNTVLKNYTSLKSNVLDIGCGYGAIGIVLSYHYKNTQFLMSDVTKTAVELAKVNLQKNNIKNAIVIQSDLYENISDMFDFIITNPPIKVGKKVLTNLIEGAHKHLNIGGHIVLVIKKSHGKDSIKKYMEETFSNCEVLKREKGYYILKSEKEA